MQAVLRLASFVTPPSCPQRGAFETAELIEKSIAALNADLNVAPLQYVVERGEQTAKTTFEALRGSDGFATPQTQTSLLSTSVQSQVPYDLLGKLAEETQLTRRTIGTILHQIAPSQFVQFRMNPGDFSASGGSTDQRTESLCHHRTPDLQCNGEKLAIDIFSQEKPKGDFSKALTVQNHIYDYVFVDSNTERGCVKLLDKGVEVEVYAKLPKTFFIPTPVGKYSPDWARSGLIRSSMPRLKAMGS